MVFLSKIVTIVAATHRHPANRLLHLTGAPVYALGVVFVVGFLTGFHTDIEEGLSLWLIAIAMFLSGHAIEGNIRSTTPVLVLRFLIVKLRARSRSRLVKSRNKLLYSSQK